MISRSDKSSLETAVSKAQVRRPALNELAKLSNAVGMADFIAPGFNPVLKDIFVPQRWPIFAYRRRDAVPARWKRIVGWNIKWRN
ncbi:hypothetical protein [Algoriphagus yeomjeoni]|uniref:hypothetical protein n=1 Tax=Algoriphagus yeomjeoni TaxID=291403 RepID=UPI000DB994CA|nr:hypothetical protein [Algoriphagus yeomjeoni]